MSIIPTKESRLSLKNEKRIFIFPENNKIKLQDIVYLSFK